MPAKNAEHAVAANNRRFAGQMECTECAPGGQSPIAPAAAIGIAAISCRKSGAAKPTW
jgi:hypothetical protein